MNDKTVATSHQQSEVTSGIIAEHQGNSGAGDAVTLGDLAGLGLEDMDLPIDVGGLPTLRLVQPRTANATRPGTFQSTSTLESYDQLENVVFLRMRPQRKYFAEDPVFDGESGLTCWSDDGRTPSPDVKVKLASQCALCPKSQWEGKRQACKVSWATIVAIGSERRVFQLEFGPASKKAGDAVVTHIKHNQLPIFGTVVDLQVDKRQTRTGVHYFSIVIAKPRLLPDAEIPKVNTLFEQYLTYPLTVRPQGD